MKPKSPAKEYALSIKQPWAALVVMGLKTIEIRRWPTTRRGRILIHAARVPDKRVQVSRYQDTEAARALAQLEGGIIGAVELTGCLSYRQRELFIADQVKHRNEPDWFEPPLLYGFTFARPEVLPFTSCKGWFRFFPVEVKVEQLAVAHG